MRQTSMETKSTRDERPSATSSRRDFLRISGIGAMALGVGAGNTGIGHASASNASAPAVGSGTCANGPYNILFIFTDQERYFRPGELPVGYSLPAHDRLMKAGTTFTNHRINSCVCTPSRSVVYTG